MSGYLAGDAFIRILPDFTGIVTRISAEAQKWGTQAGRDFTDAFNRAARTGKVPIGPSTAQAARQGTSSGGSFAEAFKRRVEASLRSLPDIKIGAATGPADQKIRDLQARLEALRSANIGVDLDAGAALAELRALQSELAAVGAQSADIKVKADFATAAAQLAAFEADLKRLNGTDATIDVRLSGGFAERVKAQIAAALQNLPEAVIGANSTQVDAKLTQIRAELGSLRDLEIGVDIDAGSALSRIAAVQVALTDLRASNPTIDVDVDAARAQAELAAIEAEVTALGADDVKIPVDTSSGISGFQALLAAGILLAPALIPIGAAITAAFAGVAVAVAGVVAAIGVVAFAVVPVVKALAAVSAAHKQAGADAARSAKQQASAAHSIEQANTDISTSTRKADEALAGLSPAGRSFVDFLRNQLGPAFSGFSKTAQQGLLPGVQKGLTALLPVLPKVKGFIGDLAGVLGDLAASAGKALAGPEFAGFFSTLATQLPGIVRLLGSIAGNLTKAFAGLFIGILPLGVSALESFNGLLERFVRWTNGLDKNNGFQSFLQYAKDSLPVVGAFLGNLFQVLGKLIEVAAPFGVLVVDVLSALFDLIGKIPPAVLAGIFVAAGIALVAFAGPVLAVIAGVTLLGIGLTYLVTHFGEVKDYITDKLGPAFSWLNDAIVQPVTTAIVAAFTNVRDFIVSYVGQVIAFVRDNWPLLLAIITGPIGLAVLAISKNWDSIRGFFSDAWTWVKDTFSALWNGATAIITKPISAAASWITDTWYPNVKTNITAAWTWMHDTFSTTWDAVTGVITKPLSSAASWITDTWYENVKTNLGVAWTWVKDTFSKTWDGVAGVLEAPFEALKTFIGAFATKEVEGSGILGGLESAFVKAVAGIGSAFDGLRALFAAPFIFLIDTVINDGLIGAYNKIAGLIPGLSKIDATVDSGFLKPHSRTNPGGYATGGILPGYTPGRDVHRFYSATGGTLDLSGGEAILRPEVTAALGADWVNDVNLAARKGGLGGVSRHLGGFFGGGILGDIAGGAVNTARGIGRAVGGAVGSVKDFALGNLRNAVRAVLGPLLEQLGGFGGGGVVTGMALGVANKLTGGLLGLAGDKDSEVPESGALPAAAGNGIVGKPTNGPYGLGYGNTYANGGYHSGQDFPVPIGTPVAAALDGVVEYVKHLTTSYGNHVAIKHPNGAETLYAHLSSTIANAGQKILGGQLLGYSGSSGNSTGPHLHFEYRTPPGGYSHAINPRDVIGTKVYDQGGYLDPGLQLVYNGTGKPEPVFTDAQFSAMTAANTTTSQRAYHYHAAEGRSMPQDDFLEAGARAEVLFVGW